MQLLIHVGLQLNHVSKRGPRDLRRIVHSGQNKMVTILLTISNACDLEIWWMTSKTIRHLFDTISSLVHHFKVIGIFKLELQSGNAQFGSKLAIFLSDVSLKIDKWPWKTIGHLFYTTSSFVHHVKSIGEVKLELQSRKAQFGSKLPIFCPTWPWNLMDDLLYYIKLCAAFQSQWYIQTRVTVWKRSIRAKIGHFLSRMTLKIDRWPWKIIWHLSYADSSFVHNFIAICAIKLELQPRNGQYGSKSAIFI